MKLINKTRYRTAELRRWTKLVANKIGVYDTRRYRRQVYFVYRRRGARVMGRGSLGGAWIIVKMLRGRQNLGEMLGIIEHEFYHNLGQTHDVMSNGGRCANWQEFEAQWLEERQIEKPNIDRKKVRHEKVIRQISDKERRVKRLQNALKKLYKKRRYYEVSQISQVSQNAETLISTQVDSVIHR